MNERSFPFNEELLEYVNGLMEYDIAQCFVSVFADGPVFFMPVFLLVWWLIYTYKNKNIQKKKELLTIFYTAVIGLFANIGFQKLFNFERPEELCKVNGTLILEHLPDASFPSDHAAMSFAFMVAVYLAGYKKTALGLFVAFTLMALARVMACVHWPYDVLVGAIFGSIVATFAFRYFTKNKYINLLNEKLVFVASKLKL